MSTSPQSASSIASSIASGRSSATTSDTAQTSLWAERTYRGLTIAAMLWILGSLWLFR
jgi:hypothetical protein